MAAATTAASSSSSGAGSLFGGVGLQGAIGAGDLYQQFGLNAVQASKSWDRYKNSITRGPTYTVQGLEKAGFNKMLAVGGTSSLGSSAKIQSHGVNQPRHGDPNLFKQGAVLDAQARLLSQQTSTNKALEDKYTQEAGRTRVEKVIAELSLPKKKAISKYFETEAGQALARLFPISEVAPKSWPELVTRGMLYVVTDAGLRKRLFGMVMKAPDSIRDVLLEMFFSGIQKTYGMPAYGADEARKLK